MLNTKANTSDVKSVKPVRSKIIVCERSEHYEYLIPNLFRDPLQKGLFIIYDCTGGIIPNLFRDPLQKGLFIVYDCTGGIIPNLFRALKQILQIKCMVDVRLPKTKSPYKLLKWFFKQVWVIERIK